MTNPHCTMNSIDQYLRERDDEIEGGKMGREKKGRSNDAVDIIRHLQFWDKVCVCYLGCFAILGGGVWFWFFFWEF